MSEAAIVADGLTKQFGNGRGCRDVTIAVEAGEAFGFLGPNGAGKSTFVKMMVGLVMPTSGKGTLLGQPIGSLPSKRLIGYLPELYRYQEWLTGEEVVRLHARLCGVDRQAADRRVPRLLEDVGIGLRGRDRVKHYSKGMQQRLGLACALVGDPPIVFLDEPSSALDPIGRMEVRRLLERLKAQGKTVFLNSHLLEDVEAVCDRIALMNDGRILRHGRVADVLQQRLRWRFKVGGFSDAALGWLREESGLPVGIPPDAGSDRDGAVWLEADLANEEQAGWLNALIVEQGLTLYEAGPRSERLESWFANAVAGLNHRGERE
ncbi:ABC transporter ATP-binding protein [Cohnella nanjingensis]|uniref:ABC transporter ATP-binding protein n=1 Tax=Cohnella nanjingensis TaxID=1387779 RepID=A0A7X0VG81_9BACL|nr:ABC transporter ATP-binding protein [Cohnella nanjingensis]MBB6672581.1 ABC transporter ATP-binding protein [Cohnella nanjingensis]